MLNEKFLKVILTTIEEDDSYDELEDLLEGGADITFAHLHNGYNALHYAVKARSLALCRFLIEKLIIP